MSAADKVLYALALFVAGFLFARPADAQTIGVHAYTWHGASNYHDSTHGLYASVPAGPVSVVAGAFLNSLRDSHGRRVSYYAGAEKRWGAFGLAAVMVSGYQRRTTPRPCPQEELAKYPAWFDVTCTETYGTTSSAWTPMLVPSVEVREFKRFIGVVPRIALASGSRKPALHLSLEWSR